MMSQGFLGRVSHSIERIQEHEAFADVLKKDPVRPDSKRRSAKARASNRKTVATKQTSSLCIPPKRLPRVAAVAPEDEGWNEIRGFEPTMPAKRTLTCLRSASQ